MFRASLYGPHAYVHNSKTVKNVNSSSQFVYSHMYKTPLIENVLTFCVV